MVHTRTFSSGMNTRRAFRPTRRDFIVACLSAATVTMWSVFKPSDYSHSLEPWSNEKHDNMLLHAEDSRHQIFDEPLLPTLRPPKIIDLMPSTKIIAHADGWTIFENLYMFNGTLLIVSNDEASSFPEVRLMTSTGLPATSEGNVPEREPTSANMDFWTRRQANVYFGTRIYPVLNTTFLFNDPPQFVDHYYHFAAELFLGAWRMFGGHLDTKIGPRGETSLADPARIIFAHCESNSWRDKIGFNNYFLRATFPSVGIETQIDWEGRVAMTQGSPGFEDDDGDSGSAKVWRFERLMLSDRSASFRGQTTGAYTHRIAGPPFLSNRDIASPYWWETVRRRVLTFANVPLSTQDYAISDLSLQEELRVDRSPPPVVVAYLSRQGWRRRLIEEDHRILQKSVEDLCKSKGWEFLVFHPENYSLDEQLRIAARITVLFGVHGNGLTHLVAMPATPISTVIEIFYPGGFARDYQWTAEALGHKHYGIWNDTSFTSPKLPHVIYVEGFQGTQIPVHGPTVAKLIADRVERRLADKPLPCIGDFCNFGA